MAAEGWFRIYRELINKPIWHLSTPEQKSILITLLCLANHDENEWEWEGKKFKVSPGQFVTSLDSIKKAAGKGISIQNVRSSLNRFKKLKFLTYQSTKAGRIVTICNWSSYQKDQKYTQQSDQQTGNKEVTTNKNDKNEKNNISVIFDLFRVEYPGTKRGLKTELEHFLRKNKPEIAELLLPALKSEKQHRENLQNSGQFVPAWKNLSTWINNRCWEYEFEELKDNNQNQKKQKPNHEKQNWD